MAKAGRKGQKPRGERKDDLERKRDERAKRTAFRKERQAKSFYSLEDDENFVSFNNQLQAIGLKIKDIPGDGNCLFRALADQLEGDHNRHRQLRRDTVHFMRENSADFQPFYDGESTFVDYLNELEQDGTYAGNDAIVAFSKNNNVDVIIHQFNSPRLVIRAPINPKKVELHLAYHNGEHYSSVRQSGDVSTGPAFLWHSKQSTMHQAPKKQATTKEDVISQNKGAYSCLNEALTVEEELVMLGTSCQDADLVRQSLSDNYGNVDSTIAYLLQLMSLTENQDEIQDSQIKLTCCKEDSSSSDGCKCQYDSPHKNQGSEVTENVAKEKRNKVHLSNRQRKELAKQEKKKRREEALRTQASSEKCDFESSVDREMDLGTVAI